MLEPGVTGSWSVRDILARVTAWEEETLTHLPTIAGDAWDHYPGHTAAIRAWCAAHGR